MAQGVNDAPAQKWHSTIQEMIDVVTQAFRGHGKANKQAEQDARIAVESIYEAFRGAYVYIPSSTATKTAMLHRQIYAEFDGHNHQALCRKYQLSVQAIYRIIKKQRALKQSTPGEQND